MLTQDQIDIIGDAISPLFQYLEHEVIVDIARRIKKTMTYTRTAELMAMDMQKLGYSPAKIRSEALKLLNADEDYKKEVEKNTLEYKKEVKKLIDSIVKKAAEAGDDLMANAGNMSWIDDMSIWESAGKKLVEGSFLNQLIDAFGKQTADQMKNLTNTTGFKSMHGYESIQNAYRHELDKAVIKLCSGTFSQEKVLNDTIHDLAQSGLRSIDFKSGRSMQLDTAAKLAIRTGCHQISAKIHDANIEQTGENLVYVSKHPGARNKGVGVENHELWQGKVYYIKPGQDYTEEAKRIGQDRIMDIWYSTGYSPDGSHTNNPLGLHGFNCRHDHYAWFEGISEFPPAHYDKDPDPVTINGKTYDYYAMTQKLRSMERNIRALKREKEALGKLGMSQTEINAKIKQKTREYREFCEKAGVPEVTSHLRVESGSSDMKSTKAYQNAVNIKNAGALSNKTDPFGRKRDKHAKSYYEEIRNRRSSYVIKRISQNGGVSEKAAKNIYEHVFMKKHAFADGTEKLFDPDYDMSESFRRILEGKNIKPHDITMLKHENLELNLMRKYNMVYEDAHSLAEQKYNYKKELDEFLERIGS